MIPTHDWIIELCDHHEVVFNANYSNFITIQEALTAKGKCIKCKLDIPADIKIPTWKVS